MIILNTENTANLVTDIAKEYFAEKVITDENTGLLVDVGKTISDNLDISNFENIVTGMFDRVNKIIHNFIKDSKYYSRYNIAMDREEFGSILEKTYIAPIYFEKSYDYRTDGAHSSFDDMFGYHALDISVKVYNTKSNFRTPPYTISLKQLKSAFVNSSEMNALISAIENMYIETYKILMRQLEKRAVNVLVGFTTYDTSITRVIDLLEQYKLDTNIALTMETCKNDVKFWSWANAYMSDTIKYMSVPSSTYNNGEQIKSTDTDNLRFVMPTMYYSVMNRLIKIGTIREDDEHKIDVIETPCLQSMDSKDEIKITMPIVKTSGKSATHVNIKNIVGIAFDKRGACICGEDIETATEYNKFDKWTNTINSFDVNLISDSNENCVVFVLMDSTGTEKAYTVTEDT